MKKISSVTTVFRRKMLPIIVLLLFLIAILYYMFFDIVFNDIAVLIFPALLLFIGWLHSFRKLEIVYLNGTYLKVNNNKIYFNDIISVIKVSLFRYKVTYRFENSIKTFFLW